MTPEQRLDAFERMYADLRVQQGQTVASLGELRAAGKEKTVCLRELLGQKLLLARQLALYQAYGL